MDIDFSIGDIPAKLTRDWFWGGMKIVTPTETLWVQHPLNPLTHFTLKLRQSWSQEVAGQVVTVEKTRPLLVAGFRPQVFQVFVGDSLVADTSGY
jgi:hypothetical protein